VIDKAIELISDPARWTTGVMARNKDNESVDYSDPEACRWCVLGALKKVGFTTDQIWPLIDRCVKKYGIGLVVANDDHGREAVIEMLKGLSSENQT
jgi:hypothetical protein